ncbi:glutamate--tRNA ligase [Prochlorococcus sp. MIT 1223]|uniref:glutamate--tRNA ligase n=1 Tax=Prochlorococcus sp. MIT 1223 TaxID=3096217 RepID=UPI002A756C6D|nr:glutamate--tRNA ligase [Prochlorococcus sp. MIT 1223]
MTVRVRLAPSPTGTLHIGTARTALFNWLFAKKNSGKFLLRIEDTDKERSKQEHLENILQGLKWLNLQWDEDLIIQSERINCHRQAIKKLLEEGYAYRCFATEVELEEMREAQKRRGEAPRYDNRYRDLSKEDEANFITEGRSYVIRFRINDEERIEWNDLVRGQMKWKGEDLGGDMVISRRANSMEIGEPLYNLVVVIDDAEMQISHVIRGEDHITNTAKQILLYKALGLRIPEFAHTPLILNSEGKKLSKRDGVTSINQFRDMGYTAEALTNYMALLGWSIPEGMNERFNIEEAAELFSFKRVNKAGAKFDWDKLNWLNSQVIHSWEPEILYESLETIWAKAGWTIPSRAWGIELSKLLGPSLITLQDSLKQSEPFFNEPELKSDGIKQLESEGAKGSLKALLEELEKNPWDGKDIQIAKSLIQEISASLKIKKGLIMKSLRASLLGDLQGPDLITTWSLLAQIDKDKNRLRKSIK